MNMEINECKKYFEKLLSKNIEQLDFLLQEPFWYYRSKLKEQYRISYFGVILCLN